MTYETAQRLKESGFPQVIFPWRGHVICVVEDGPGEAHSCELCAYVPTSDELIRELGDKLFGLTRASSEGLGLWRAYGWPLEGEDVGDGFKDAINYMVGSKPDEALAELYIATKTK